MSGHLFAEHSKDVVWGDEETEDSSNVTSLLCESVRFQVWLCLLSRWSDCAHKLLSHTSSSHLQQSSTCSWQESEDSKEDGKEESKEEKQDGKEETKEESKDDKKDESKEESKEDDKQDNKEESKEDGKEETKEENKEDKKEESKEESKDESKEEHKEEEKGGSKEEESKEESKESPKESAKKAWLTGIIVDTSRLHAAYREQGLWHTLTDVSLGMSEIPRLAPSWTFWSHCRKTGQGLYKLCQGFWHAVFLPINELSFGIEITRFLKLDVHCWQESSKADAETKVMVASELFLL